MDLPTKQAAAEAEQLIATEFFLPTLLEKLAAYDIRPKTEAELGQLVQLGAMLQQAEAQGTFALPTAKQAQEGNPFLAHAISKLASHTAAPVTDEQLQQNAVQLVKDHPLAKSAALIYAHAVRGGELAEE